MTFFQNISHSGKYFCHDITAPKREQAQHYSLLTHKSYGIFIIAFESFFGTYYLNILFFSHSILHAIKKLFASTISMVLYNQALFRQANILDLFYCSCTKLHTKCKTLAKTLKKKKGYFECPTWYIYKNPELRWWAAALFSFERRTLRYPRLNVRCELSDLFCISL